MMTPGDGGWDRQGGLYVPGGYRPGLYRPPRPKIPRYGPRDWSSPDVRRAAIGFVQTVDSGLNLGSSSDTVNLTPTAGNLLVLASFWGDTGVDISSVGDDQSNTWNELTLRTSAGSRCQIWYANGVAGASTTITTELDGTDNWGFIVCEYSGIATSSPLDVEDFGSGTGTSMDSGNFTTAVDNSLIFACAFVDSSTDVDAGTGFTMRDSITFGGSDLAIAEDDLTNTAGTNNATASCDSSVGWGIAVAVFKPAGGTNFERSVSYSGLATFVPAAVKNAVTSPAFSGDATFAPAAVKNAVAAWQGSGAATFSPAAVKRAAAQLQVSGAAALTLAAIRNRTASCAFDGVGSLTIAAVKNVVASVSFSCGASFECSATSDVQPAGGGGGGTMRYLPSFGGR